MFIARRSPVSPVSSLRAKELLAVLRLSLDQLCVQSKASKLVLSPTCDESGQLTGLCHPLTGQCWFIFNPQREVSQHLRDSTF